MAEHRFYQIRKSDRRRRRDVGLWIGIAAVAVVFVICILPIITSLLLSSNYKQFVNHYTDSMNVTRANGFAAVSEDGETFRISADYASKIYGLLLDIGMGKPQTKVPQTSPVTVELGDGALLQFWSVEIKEKNALRDTGLFVKYESQDGYCYQYDTDKLTLTSVANYLIPS